MIRKFVESEMFSSYLNKNNAIQNNIMGILSGSVNVTYLNSGLSESIYFMRKMFKDSITNDCVAAIESGQMSLVLLPLNNNIPECIPFIVYAKNGNNRVIVNLTRFLDIKEDKTTKKKEYSIDPTKLFCLVSSAYLAMTLFTKEVVSSSILSGAAIYWAEMFTKVLNRAIGLNTNRDRYDAFKYFAIRFFLTYFCNANKDLVESVSLSYINNNKSDLLLNMENTIKERGIDINESFTTFCRTLFDNSISLIKGVRVNKIDENINVSFFVKRFIDMYNFAAFGSLVSLPYHIYTLICARYASGIVNDRSLEDILKNEKTKDASKLFVQLFKEAR